MQYFLVQAYHDIPLLPARFRAALTLFGSGLSREAGLFLLEI